MDEFKFQAIKAHINSLTDIAELTLIINDYTVSDLERQTIENDYLYLLLGGKRTKTDIKYYDKLTHLAAKRKLQLTQGKPKLPFPANNKPPHRR